MSSKQFSPFKDIFRNLSEYREFTGYYACRIADLNLILAAGTTNRFTFQMVNSLMESWGVHLN